MGGDCGQGPAGERRLSSIHPSFLRPQDATLALASRRQAWIRLIAFSAHVTRQFRLRLFLQHFRGALPGHCGPLAEMLDSITAKKVRSRRILFKSGSCEQYSGIVSDEKREMGRKVTIGYEPHFAKTARISRESAMEGWRRGRWGSFGRCIAGTGFANGGGMVTGTWILPRSLMMSESARRGREERHRTYHAVCR